MNTEEITPTITQIIKQVLNSWESQNKSFQKFLNNHEDEFYFKQVAPSRNRAIYLIGHLVAVSDNLLPLLALGPKLFPAYGAMFLAEADGVIAEIPSIAELKSAYERVHSALTEQFLKMEPQEWLQKHTAVSDEDFSIDPMRNKLNVLLSRTTHMSYHLGQLILIK